MLRYWYQAFPKAATNEQDYWRARLVLHVLLLTTLVFTLLTLLNLTYFAAYTIAAIDFTGLLTSLGLYALFRRSQNVSVASWLVAVCITAILISFLFSAQGRAYSLLWASIIPPLTFFLVGRRAGTVLSALAFASAGYIISQQLAAGEQMAFTQGALFNLIEVTAVQLMLFNFYEGTRASAFTQLRLQHQQLQTLAQTDALTGLHNRMKFEQEILTNTPADNQACLVVIDIDHFKAINDQHGHHIGDQVLQQVAQLLHGNMRSNDSLARWGGEEFVVLLRNITLTEAESLVNRWRVALRNTTAKDIPVTISAGLTPIKQNEAIDVAFKRADTALYSAKNSGRDAVNVASAHGSSMVS